MHLIDAQDCSMQGKLKEQNLRGVVQLQAMEQALTPTEVLPDAEWSFKITCPAIAFCGDFFSWMRTAGSFLLPTLNPLRLLRAKKVGRFFQARLPFRVHVP